MRANNPDTNELLKRAVGGDATAANQLLLRHRDRLRQMVWVRIDPRLSSRVDPSDVVQEVLIEAARKLSDYIQRPHLSFYAWLRQIAWDRLAHLSTHHIRTQKRSVEREVDWQLSDESLMLLAERFTASSCGPSKHAIRKELRDRVRTALNRMASSDREVLMMWYLEQLPIGEIAAVLKMSESGVKSRHRRALARITSILSGESN